MVIWDASKDQFLLVKMAEHIKPSSEQIASIISKWPANLGPAPTSRAITEHFVKLRAGLGKAGVGNFAVSGAKGIGTPRTPRSQATKTPVRGAKKAKGTASKRKRSDSSDSEEAESTADDVDTPTHPSIKPEPVSLDSEDEAPVTPRKTLMRGTKTPEKMAKQAKYVQEVMGADSEDSEAAPGEEGEYVPMQEE